MRIAYVAKHWSGGNDDEGAIHYALEKLGHNVQRLKEQVGRKADQLECDFLLFHHWPDAYKIIPSLKTPAVFWNFDLVEWPDPTLEARNHGRRQWMQDTISLVQLGFCTDGDWVRRDTTKKLVRLTQGADERVVGSGSKGCCPLCQCERYEGPDILFTGTRNGGKDRQSFVEEMERVYGDRFKCVQGYHGRQLADMIANSKIIVAPDSPVTDHYWSNRVYNTLGFGGFLLHPYSETLRHQYDEFNDLRMYKSREDLHEQIAYYLGQPSLRKRIQSNGLCKTTSHHLYRHRCEILVATVKERLGL